MAVKKVIMVAGTFEIVHPGHLFLLKRAARLGKVSVVVSRDKNAAKAKGRMPAVHEAQRLEVIRNIKCVGSAILGDRKNFTNSIRRLRPDVILLGPDQMEAKKLRALLGDIGLPKTIRVVQLPKRYEKKGFICRTSEIIGKIRKSDTR